jgi:vesicular inhibitory amino acid transporter
MFGDDVRDAITSNILAEASYPRALTALMCLCIAIIPLTKIPLNARPIVSTVEVVLGVSDSQQQQQQYQGDRGGEGRGRGRALVKGAIKIGVVVVFLGISIVFPAFDSIMAFMGSALCFTICVT